MRSFLDSYVLAQNFSPSIKFVFPALDNSVPPGQIYLSPVPIAIGMAKIAPWCLARRDNFAAKAPGLVTA